MKNRLLSASLIGSLSLVSPPALAQAVTGHVAATLGNVEVDTGVSPLDADTYGVEGAIFVPLTYGIVVQGDAAIAKIDDGGSFDAGTASVHVGYRDAEWAAGVYIGASDSGDTDSSGKYYGAEALYYGPALTVSAGIGQGEIDDLNTDLRGGSTEGRLFISDDIRLDGRLGVFKREVGPLEQDGISYGAGIEWRPMTFPLSMFATFDSLSVDDTDFDLSIVQVGIRFDFGGGTLKIRDRSGATFRPMSGLEAFVRQL